jgi:hypothetical protein
MRRLKTLPAPGLTGWMTSGTTAEKAVATFPMKGRSLMSRLGKRAGVTRVIIATAE